jgi:hypothetical protein
MWWLGVPVVTTSVGAEGLELEHDRNCLVAGSATAFAAACIRLLGFVTERNRLGQAMREDAMAAYSHAAVSRIVPLRRRTHLKPCLLQPS